MLIDLQNSPNKPATRRPLLAASPANMSRQLSADEGASQPAKPELAATELEPCALQCGANGSRPPQIWG